MVLANAVEALPQRLELKGVSHEMATVSVRDERGERDARTCSSSRSSSA
jgi:hypothetical protein